MDLQTTGGDPARDQIAEIAILTTHPGGGCTTYRKTLAGESASALGATLGPYARRVLRELDGCDLAAFDLHGFVLPFLKEAFCRTGLDLPLKGRLLIDVKGEYQRMEAANLASVARALLRQEPRVTTADCRAATTSAVLDALVARHGAFLKGPAICAPSCV